MSITQEERAAITEKLAELDAKFDVPPRSLDTAVILEWVALLKERAALAKFLNDGNIQLKSNDARAHSPPRNLLEPGAQSGNANGTRLDLPFRE